MSAIMKLSPVEKLIMKLEKDGKTLEDVTKKI